MNDEPLPSGESELDALVFEFLERAESAPADWSRALDELCAREPSRASQLRQRVELLAKSGLWGAPPGGEAEIPERLGEFRILRRLGRGGMGVVYLAEQPSVGRRVALKLIRGEQLHAPSARARFVREARAIARLDHPSIVRVFTIGEEQDLPFLAMEYVSGAALDALLDRLAGREPGALSGSDARAALTAELNAAAEDSSSQVNAESFARGWVEFAVRVVRDVASALQHAHERGVLHRDVKPSNVLLSVDGRVRLCDFGLAALSGGEELTRSGAQLGSLPYMAPEQLRGESAVIGAATDVYGLGVTLYELVTLARPFRGQSEAAVRGAILDARPAPMRQLNPSASADIETVCAKAMDPDPRRRYATAAEFASDLSNVLELRPIHARPPSVWTRARRWTQRRPAAAVAVAAGALLALAGPLGWELNRMRTMEAVRVAYERERVARAQSERDFRAALNAVGHVLRGLAADDLRDAPRMQRVRLAAIQRAQSLFDELERDRGDDPQLVREGADLYESQADVLYDMGRHDEAVASYSRAEALVARMSGSEAGVDLRLREAEIALARAKALQGRGGWNESREPLDRAEALLREVTAEGDASVDAWRTFALSLANSAEVLQLLGNVEDARARLEEARELVERLVREAPESAEAAWCAGRVLGDLGDLIASEEEPARALALLERRFEEHRRAQRLEPARRSYRFDAAFAAISLASALSALREDARAEALLLAAAADLDALIEEFPDAERYVTERWRLDQVLGGLYGRAGRVNDALSVFRASAARVGRRSDQAPERSDLALFAAQAEYNVATGGVHARVALAETEAALDRVESRVGDVLAREPGHAPALELLRMSAYNRALARCLSGELDRAHEAVRDFDKSRREERGDLRYCSDLWNELVLALRRTAPDDSTRAERERAWTERMFERLEAAVDAGYRDAVELDSTPALESFRSDERFLRLRKRCAIDAQ